LKESGAGFTSREFPLVTENWSFSSILGENQAFLKRRKRNEKKRLYFEAEGGEGPYHYPKELMLNPVLDRVDFCV